MGPLVICLNSDTPGSGDDMLDHVLLGAYLETGASRTSNVLIVDYDGKLIEKVDKTVIENPADAAHAYNQDNLTLFFVSGTRLEIYYKTKILDCIPNIFTHNRSVIVSELTLPVGDYRVLVDKHYKERIGRKNLLSYWENKSKRFLVPAPEKIFGRDLGYYLDQNVADGHIDTECYNAWTDDRTDIRVIRDADRHVLIIEIKWLGASLSRNGKLTRHADARANSGIAQLNTYLKEDPLSFCGVLVLYDARVTDTEIKYDTSIQRDNRMETPLRYYLISESASKEGERIAKQSKAKGADKGSRL